MNHILALGAHPDDIELGCGGTLARIIRECNADVRALVFTYGKDLRGEEAREGFDELGEQPGWLDVRSHLDQQLDAKFQDLIGDIERALPGMDYLFTHAPQDTHPDHVAVTQAALAAVRARQVTVLFYETASTIPNSFQPNYFVCLSDADWEAKMGSLKKHQTQENKSYLRPGVLYSHAQSYAMKHGRQIQLVEAFHAYRVYWKLPA